jgi:nitrate reductase NapAB chaperone NapD
MLTGELKKFTQNITLTHFYFSELRLTKLRKYGSLFANYESLDIQEQFSLRGKYDFIVIELIELNKKKIETINEIIKKCKTKNIIVFADDYKNNTLTKFLIYSSLHSAYPLIDDDKKTEKVISSYIKKLIEKKKTQQQINISKKIDSSFVILLLKQNRLTFANKNAQELFESEDLKEIQEKVLEIQDITEIEPQNSLSTSITKGDGSVEHFRIYSNDFLHTDEKLITLIKDKEEAKEIPSLTIDRFEFIEILKDVLVQNSIEQNNVVLIVININNYEKLKKNSTSIAIHNMMKDILEVLFHEKATGEKLSYWNAHSLIIHINEEKFETIKENLREIHEKLIYLNHEDHILPSITSTAIDIGQLDINEAINCIEDISNNSYKRDKTQIENFYELSNLNDFLDEQEQINYLLNNHLNNETQIKLLNIYKGLCINTKSKILKIKDGDYFVSCEKLQAYSMKSEEKTIIQSPSLPKDIRAHITYVNMKESYAVLNNLVFLDSSANNRKHTRVQPRIRMPISIKHKEFSIQGTVIDVSTKAIAIMINHAFKDEYLHETIDLNFKLPSTSSDDGFHIMNVEAKIANIIETKESKIKLITILDLSDPYDTYLLEYMYNRQKELIMDLKRASKF